MGIWQTAKEMAVQTPEGRNRYVDFLRALSISAVVVGHWLIAGFIVADGDIQPVAVLATMPETQWLTWLFQVMPIFFIVGGYANAVSLQSAERKQHSYAEWLASRLDRLLRPLLPLVGFWVLLSILMLLMKVEQESISMVTQMALIPTWFLAIYTLVVVFAPVTYRLWQRYDVGSVFLFAGLAILVDMAVFLWGQKWVGWSNYLWIWLCVHQLGYAWYAGRFKGSMNLILTSLVSWVLLAVLVFYGPYPLAMVGSPDPELSNTLPPKVTLLVLGVAQFSLMMLLEKPANQWLLRVRVWAATVLINSMIMTLYLWHITVMLLVVWAMWQLDGIGLTLEPGEVDWWATRPLWIAGLLCLLLPVSLALSAVERTARPDSRKVSGLRLVSGSVLICLGIAYMAMFGLGDRVLLDVAVLALALGGVLTAGVASLRLLRPSS